MVNERYQLRDNLETPVNVNGPSVTTESCTQDSGHTQTIWPAACGGGWEGSVTTKLHNRLHVSKTLHYW